MNGLCKPFAEALEAALAECAGGPVRGPRPEMFVGEKRGKVLVFLTYHKHEMGNPLALGVALGDPLTTVSTFHLN